MAYRIPCSCGKGVFAELTDAGARLACGCGRTVQVPNLSALRRRGESDRSKPATAPPPSEAETEARRNLVTGRWWLLAGVAILGVGLLVGSQFPPGMCFDFIGLGAVVLGLLRLTRGIVQRRMGEP